MPHWLQALIATAGALAGWRWVLRPVRRVLRELRELLAAIRTAGVGIERLSLEMHALSGSVIRLVVVILDEQAAMRAEFEELRVQHQALSQLVIDLDADVRRFQRDHGEG